MRLETIDLFSELTAAPVIPVSQRVRNEQTGLIGEFFACMKLAEMGFTVIHHPSKCFDALVEVEGSMLRVQIKARSGTSDPYGSYYFPARVSGRSDRGSREYRALTELDIDLYAFVALDLQKIVFLAASRLQDKLSIMLRRADFMAENAATLSFERAMADLSSRAHFAHARA